MLRSPQVSLQLFAKDFDKRRSYIVTCCPQQKAPQCAPVLFVHSPAALSNTVLQ